MRSAMKVGGEVKGLCLECKAKGHWSLAQPIRSPDFKASINSILNVTTVNRVAEVEGARERRSPKGQGLLRKEGPPTYAILSRNLVLSRFTRFLKGFHRAFN